MPQNQSDADRAKPLRLEFRPGPPGHEPRPPDLAHAPRVSLIETEAWERAVAARLRLVVGYIALRDIGRLTGSNRESVRRYMRRGRVSGLFLARFADAFGVPLEWLITGAAVAPAGAPRGGAGTGQRRHRFDPGRSPDGKLAATPLGSGR